MNFEEILLDEAVNKSFIKNAFKQAVAKVFAIIKNNLKEALSKLKTNISEDTLLEDELNKKTKDKIKAILGKHGFTSDFKFIKKEGEECCELILSINGSSKKIGIELDVADAEELLQYSRVFNKEFQKKPYLKSLSPTTKLEAMASIIKTIIDEEGEVFVKGFNNSLIKNEKEGRKGLGIEDISKDFEKTLANIHKSDIDVKEKAEKAKVRSAERGKSEGYNTKTFYEKFFNSLAKVI